MLRISISESMANSATLRLEGQIAGPWTEELSSACEQALDAGRTLTLDLGDVSMIDRHALGLLGALSRRSVVFAHCSPFREWQLKHLAGYGLATGGQAP